MTHAIDTIEDLIRILDEHPQWQEALRERLLSRELLAMPERLAELATRMDQSTGRMDQLTEHMDHLAKRMDQLTEHMDQLTERVDQLTKRMDQLTERMDQLTKRMDQLTERMDQLTERMDQLTERMDHLAKRMDHLAKRVDQLTERVDQLTERMDQLTERMDQLTERVDQLTERMDQLTERVDQLTKRMDQLADGMAATNRRLDRVIDDLGTLKGHHAGNATRSDAALIAADLGLRYTKALTAPDLLRITDSANTAAIAANELRSFHHADLVVQAADQNGGRCFVAVEASYTANGRDTVRAIRNARFLTEFTGCRSYAAVAGYRLDDRIRKIVDSGEVFWYQLEPESLQAE